MRSQMRVSMRDIQLTDQDVGTQDGAKRVSHLDERSKAIEDKSHENHDLNEETR